MIDERRRAAAIFASASLVVLAPLPFGGTSPWSQLALGLLAGALLLLAAFESGAGLRPRARIALLVVTTALFPLLFALPLPFATTALVSPRVAEESRASLAAPGEPAGLAAAERLIATAAGGERQEPSWRPLSADLDATMEAAARLLLALAAFVAGLLVVRGSRDRRVVAAALGVSAFAQAIYGLAETFSGHRHVLTVAKTHLPELPSGTFINPNHYAASLSLGLFALVGLALSRPRERDGSASTSMARTMLIATAAAVVAIALAWTSSRGAIAAAAAAGVALLAAGVARARLSARGALARVVVCGVIAALCFSLALYLKPPEPLLDDFADVSRGGASRVALVSAAWSIFEESPLAGSGPGTFRYMHALSRPRELGAKVLHAHNDYVEWLAETGVAGGAVALMWLVALLAGAARAIRRSSDRALDAMLAGGLAALALHETVDFALQLPGVAVPAALTAGALLAPRNAGPTPTAPLVRRRIVWRAAAATLAVLVVVVPFVSWTSRRLPSADAGVRHAFSPLLSAESRRSWARARVEHALREAAAGREPARDELIGRIGPAVLALQRAGLRAPLRGETRITSWLAVQTLLAGAPGLADPEPARELADYYLDRAEALEPASRARALTLIRYRKLAGQAAAARRIARDLVGADPRLASRVYGLLGGERLGLADLLEATPNQPRAALELARYLVDMRQDREAARIVLRRALDAHPGEAILALRLAALEQAAARHERALELLEAAARAGGDRRDVLRLRTRSLIALGDREGTDGALVELAAAGEAPERIALLRARALVAARRVDEAVALLEPLVAEKPSALSPRQRLDALLTLAGALESGGRMRDALDVYREVERLEPGHPRAQRFFERLDDAAGARE